MTNAHERASAAYQRSFGREHALAARAPGRVNLIGEHIDYCGGNVLPMAIDRDCVAVGGLRGQRVRVYAADVDDWLECDPGDLHDANRFEGWRAYAAGVLAFTFEAMREWPRGFEIVIASDVPLGAGLSSSAAFEVSLTTLLAGLMGRSLDAWEVARLCRRAEHEYARVPCGIMDQAIAAMARRGHAMLLDCETERVVGHMPMPSGDEVSLLVVDTRVRHAHSGGEYAARRAACEAAARALGEKNLCEARLAHLDALTQEWRAIARHVVSENQRTQAAAEAMKTGDWPDFGRLMNESHDSLRDDYRVSCAELDIVVDAAREVPGVLGARMTGGGFGGCAIVLAPAVALPEIRGRVSREFRGRFTRDCGILDVHASAGAALIG